MERLPPEAERILFPLDCRWKLIRFRTGLVCAQAHYAPRNAKIPRNLAVLT